MVEDEEALALDEETTLDLLGNEELIVDLNYEECLLDQKAQLNCIDYETNSYTPNVVDVGQPIIPITKAHYAAAIAPTVVVGEEYQPVDPSSILQLTPPQSPPQFEGYKQQPELSPAPVLVKVEQKQCYATDAIPATAPATPFGFNSGNWVAGSEIARKNQLIDDIVNMRALELERPPNCQQLNDDCESQDSSSMGCSSSSSGSSNSSRVSGSIADVDEDWLPEQTSSSHSSPAHTSISMDNAGSTAAPKKRTRTYGRGVEDRRIRKKEQNKNAATRYRQKKKIEMESVLGEEQELTQENEGLRRTLRERRSEMRYLRQLIREFYQERKR
ncbi:blast:Activating transcription factor of chaperone [Drosophila guanche]|nr:blast:Activating transcription factor of chaperone [Drosophila guanche]